MQYQVITATTFEKLAIRVNEMIAAGWIPLGGVAVAVDQGRYDCVQAMTKG